MRLKQGLPVEEVLDELGRALETKGSAVLCAAPGAGKTTLVPPFLFDAPFLKGGKTLILEPRRIAARASACRVAALLGESVGRTVGYRTRLDSKTSAATRIEFLTEGILTRMIQDDPALEGVALLVFDEFHERSVNADLGLALSLEAKGALREDLRILVMSATLDAERVAGLLDDAPVVSSKGRLFEIETVYLGRRRELRLEDEMAKAIGRALSMAQGDVLAFLPGEGEIRRTMSALGTPEGCAVMPLYGNLTPEAQDAALQPDRSGRRKIILATSIAETSLTVEGVRIVVDSGLMRVPRFNPRSGMGSLETLKVSKASAEQRRGRAGRLGPGLCLRLWSAPEQEGLAPFNTPEIMEADMAPLALELANWGVEPMAARESMRWLDPPPAPQMAAACDLLKDLGALDASGRISEHGRKLLKMPLHPRLAHMVSKAAGAGGGAGALASEMAALLSERDIAKGTNSDIRERLGARSASSGLHIDPNAKRRIAEAAAQIRRVAGIKRDSFGDAELEMAGVLLGFAYPDRIGMWRRPNSGEYALSNGKGAKLRKGDPLGANQFIVAAQSEGPESSATVFIAAPLDVDDVEKHFHELLSERVEVSWDESFHGVSAAKIERLGDLVLAKRPMSTGVPREKIAEAFMEGLRKEGLARIPWPESCAPFRARVNFLRKHLGEDWPDMTDEGLLATLEDWLLPFLGDAMRVEHLKRVPLREALDSLIDHKQRQSLGKLAPERLEVPSGSHVKIDYDAPDAPAVSVKLQELFGLQETPRLAGGKAPITFRILSPSMRPVQVTQDLAGFWRESYFLVRKDMRGRYPKHDWPENPLEAVAHRGVKRRA